MDAPEVGSLSRDELEAEVRRLRAECGERLESSERRQRAVFDGAVDFAIIVTDRGGVITDWNSGAAHIFGWSDAEMRGQTADRFFTPEDRAAGRVETEMRLALRDGRAADERWHIRKDGSRFWASGEMMPLRDESGAHLGFTKIVRDRTKDHAAGRALEDAVARLRRAQEAGGVGLFSVEIADDIVRATPEFCRLYGLAPREIYPAEAFQELVLPEDAYLVSSAAARTRGEIVEDVEYRIRRADTGELRWIARRGEIEHDATGKPVRFSGVVRDITEQRASRDAQERSEERYRTFVETAEAAFAIVEVKFDDDETPIDYRFIEANAAFERQAGVDLRGKWVTEFAPDLERFWFETYGRVALTGEPAMFESRAEAFNRWFDVRAQRIGDPALRRIAIFFTDATARIEARLRDATLLDLGDRLGAITDPNDIAFAACQVVGEKFGVSLVGFGAVDPVAETIFVDRDWTARGAKTLAGLIHFRDYGSYIDDLKRGDAVVVPDARTDARTRDHAALLEERSARAFINLPVFEHGKFAALLFVAQAEPRGWSDADLSLIRDVAERTYIATERARSQRALEESEEQFRAFAQAVPNQIWVSRPDGYLYWFNDRVYAYTGAVRGSLYGDGTWRDRVVHAQDRRHAADAWAASLATGQIFEVEYRIRRSDGSYRWFLVRAVPVREAGAITRWIGTNTDIDENKRQAARLAFLNVALEDEVAQRTRDRDRIWRNSTDVMLVARFDATITAVNPAWTTLFGWREDELIGRSFMDLVHPDDVETTSAATGDLSAGSLIPRFENRYRHRDGSYRWMSWTAVPDEHLIHAIGRDFTAEKEHALVLAATEEQLRQAQKMEVVGQLTGGIAHDFNNLLTGITGSLELLSARVAQGRYKDVERYTTAAHGAAQRAAALTHRLLAFSRRQTLDPKATDVNRLVFGMEELIRRTVGPAITVEAVAAGGLWMTLIDPPQLESALLNLCINARDAMPDGGRITIETANRHLDPKSAAEHDLKPGAYVSLAVRDTGTGMSPEVVAKVFEPFFTTKPSGQGTGLGLSMIYGFTQQSGGQVSITSEVGVGTTMCLLLPRYIGEETTDEHGRELSEASRASQGETVLVVDDEPTIRMLVKETLEELGYAAIEAMDGPSGLEILDSDARVDLVVTDVGLPGTMNGRQMVDAARVRRPGLKVLFITGYAENAVVGGGHLAPGMHVMTKPFAMEALLARIKDVINEA